MTQLARQFEENPQVRYGLTAMCIGIGMGGAVIWENPHHSAYQSSAYQSTAYQSTAYQSSADNKGVVAG